MSRDKVQCSFMILYVVAQCSVKSFDDVAVFVAEFHFGVFGTIS